MIFKSKMRKTKPKPTRDFLDFTVRFLYTVIGLHCTKGGEGNGKIRNGT